MNTKIDLGAATSDLIEVTPGTGASTECQSVARPPRSISGVLMRATLVVALVLGTISGLIQLSIDVGQEKNAVEANAVEFIKSVLPAAEEAVYDLDDKLAQRVIEGLFTQRAITQVRLLDIDQPMVELRRDPMRTLPAIRGFTDADEIVVRQVLFIPGSQRDKEVGSIEVTVDRSIVAPAIVNRLLLYFLLACLKNFLLGLALVGLIYASMARYFVAFAQVLQAWQPGDGPLTLPSPPRFLENTEIAVLAKRVDFLARNSEEALGAMEETVKQQTKSLERERELGALQRQFVFMVSHEFRTPLAIIDMVAQRLKRHSKKPMKERGGEASDVIRKSVHRLVELMEGVLAAAKIDNGKIELDPGPCNLAQDLAEMAANYRELNPKHQIETDLGGLPESFTADGKFLRQIFSNLISNAIKYSPEGTEVRIKGWQTQNGGVAVSVADRGVGIPEDELPNLCERFFRASTSVGTAGTGIGLYMCRTIVDLHGGNLKIESKVGEGTVFTVELPDGACRSSH